MFDWFYFWNLVWSFFTLLSLVFVPVFIVMIYFATRAPRARAPRARAPRARAPRSRASEARAADAQVRRAQPRRARAARGGASSRASRPNKALPGPVGDNHTKRAA